MFVWAEFSQDISMLWFGAFCEEFYAHRPEIIDLKHKNMLWVAYTVYDMQANTQTVYVDV